jgi:class 3 adenylate cyclase|tara:strand:+ start:268 stop:2433 length:2166 start_codon:yes stop_codon:yes gene_type:complete
MEHSFKFFLFKKYLFIILTLMLFVCGKYTFAVEPFVLDTGMLETIPPKNLNFLEGLDHDVPFEVLENAEWTENLFNAQSMVDGYWVKFVVKNNSESNVIGINHNWNMEKKLYVKNSLGLKEYPYWKHRKNVFVGQEHIGAQYRILMPQNENTIIYDFFRSRPFDRYMAKVNGLDRMTIGLWEDVRFRELVRFSSNIGFIAVALSFGIYYFFIYLVSKGDYLWLSLSLLQATATVFFTQSNGLYMGISRWPAISEMQFVFQGLLFLFLIIFFKQALNLKEKYPRINKLFLLGITFYSLIIILNFFTSLSWPHEEQFNLLKYPPDNLGPGIVKFHYIVIPFAVLLILSIVISFILWRKGDASAGYLCLSFTLPFLTLPLALATYFIFDGFNWIFMLVLSSSAGFLFLSMFVTFGFAVAQNMNDLKKFALEQQMRLTEAYQRFVPKQLLTNLNKDSILDVQLGDQVQKEMSILFSDIRSFTTLSESMLPEENFKFVNTYLSKMGPIVRENNGYIDKFIGDAIMALFEKSPDDAVRTSVKMLDALREYNKVRIREGNDPIRIGIGVNTGMMMLGTLGESDRMEGSVISDAVNIAARLEGLTKLYKTPLLISGETLLKIDDSIFETRLIDKVAVKGKVKPIMVHEVLNGETPDLREIKISMLPNFKKCFELYQNQKFENALELFRKYLKKVPEDHVGQLYVDRCQKILSSGWDSENWEGINYMDNK